MGSNCVKNLIFKTGKFYLSVLIFFGILTIVNGQPLNRQYNNEVIDYTNICKVVDGSMIKEKSFIFQINNKDGNELAEISIPFQQKNEI